MPTFVYTALDIHGQRSRGRLEAPDRPAAIRDLVLRGISVTDIAEQAEGAAPSTQHAGSGRRLRIRPKQLAVLTRQLAISLEAGLPLMTGLEVMGKELDHPASRQLLKELSERVHQGVSLSEALAEYPGIFSPMYVRLVRVGETGGVLEAVLTRLADMMERQQELRDRVSSASIYPLILLLLGIASVAVIVTFIVPRIVESIAGDKFLLPWPTRVLMAMSGCVASGWWLFLALSVAIAAGWRQYVLRGPGRRGWDAFKLRVPILGRLIRQIESARFARSLGVLTHGGVSITEAMAVVRDTVGNAVIRGALHELADSIRGGESIAGPLQRSGLFPALLVQMVHLGENTGRLDEMLLRAAAVHEAEARTTLDRLVSILPVALVLLLACVIGFIAAGLVLAIIEFQGSGLGALGQ
jgi:general secretion pathway protein F